jgi:signal transduction histidine kinase
MAEMGQDKLAKELAQKKAEVDILRQISLEINSTLILEEIFDIVLRTMDELFGFHHAIILLPDTSGDTLTVVASRGYETPVLGAKVKFGTGIIGVVAKKRKLMRASNLGQQRRYASAIRKQMKEAGRAYELDEVVEVPGLADVESQIAIPLLIKDTLIGVFSVESSEQRIFSEREEILVTIVANQAASAIHNARLYAHEERRREELAEAHERLQQLNETLEARVRDRTRELEETNRDLRETQAQLVQSGKMASLGMLAAGIVHEINTPIGAIHSNADVQRRSISIIQDALTEPALAEQLRENSRLDRAFTLLQTTNDITQEAVGRIVKIIRSLKSFARLDQAELESVNLHEGVDSSLTLLQHLLKGRITIVKNYGPLPAVQCYASQINQVFMNLLTNAAQAIGEEGTITVTTRRDGACAVVEIADTGSGIKPDHLKQVFDPGFTTKGVGVGAGLGLPIAYRIIEDHHGTIDIQSEPDKGTTITLRLPLVRPG